jgi:arylsulfatase B
MLLAAGCASICRRWGSREPLLAQRGPSSQPGRRGRMPMMPATKLLLLCVALGQLLPSAAPAPATDKAVKPHLFLFIVDDLGYGNVGWTRTHRTPEVHTPTMDSLVAEGVELQRFYVFSCCSPSRASVLSGRLPPHVETWLTDFQISNPADTESGWAGIPRSMTGLAAVLKQAQYRTHAVGKWDAGMATPQHTPRGRGFDTSLIYYGHENDYWTRRQGGCATNSSAAAAALVPTSTAQKPPPHPRHVPCIDLWRNDQPARALDASVGSTYEEYLFRDEALRVLSQHPPSVRQAFPTLAVRFD